ncbi:MAG TPA: ABC transporter permease [Chryseosolibacter sp.]
MLKSFIRIFIRSTIKDAGYSILHIAGLTLGLASFIFITLYVLDELSFDRYHGKANRIYRIHQNFESDGLGEKAASLPFPILEPLLNDYKGDIETYCRFFNFQAPFLTLATEDGDKYFNESRVYFTDSTLFNVFDFELLEGNRSTALRDRNTIVITRSMADKYFPNESPVGKTLKLQQRVDLLITGVIADTPANSHFAFDFLISFTTIKEFYASGNYPTNWSWNPVWTFLLLKDEDSRKKIENHFPAFITKYYPEAYHKSVTLLLFPLTDIHLHSAIDYEIAANNSLTTLYILASIGLVVIVIAAINFINLSTARSARRSLEVGMRKTLGGERKELILQFLVESICFTLLSTILAFVFVTCLLPWFNALAEKNISALLFLQPVWLIGGLLFPIVLGTVAGLYPAFVLSSLQPVTILSRSTKHNPRSRLRQTLVVFQFALSIILLIGTGVIFDQLKFLRDGQTGFEKENVILIPVMRTGLTNAQYETLKDEFLANRRVIGVTAVEDIVGSKHQVYSYKFEGLPETRPFPALQVRHDFAKTFDVKLLAGRDYSEEFVRDDSTGLVVNESLVKSMGWKTNEEAIGKQFDDNPDHKIIGVVKDFNFTSRHSQVRPLVLDLVMHPASFSVFIKYIAVRISPEDRQSTLQHLQDKWKTMRDGWPFEYFFIDSNLKNLYKAEDKLSAVTMIFSGLAIVVGCLGLFGLATYAAHLRSREMSIRKVLGGSAREIFTLFCKSFVTQIVVAVVIALPAAWLILDLWLSTFSYRTEISIKWLVVGPLVAMVIALVTVSYHAVWLSNADPAKVLKE